MIAYLFSCMCGHHDRDALPFTAATAALAWWPFVSVHQPRFVCRMLTIIAVIVTTLLLAKNIADVLWFGHSPVF